MFGSVRGWIFDKKLYDMLCGDELSVYFLSSMRLPSEQGLRMKQILRMWIQ